MGGNQNRPKRTLTWKLGVDAEFETGGFEVPLFSSTFTGAKTMVGGRARNNKNPPAKLDLNIYRGLGCKPPL